MEQTLRLDGEEREVTVERAPGRATVRAGERTVDLAITQIRAGEWSVLAGSRHIPVRLHETPRGVIVTTPAGAFPAELLDPRRLQSRSASASGGGANEITAPMPGKIVALSVAPGDSVEPGQSVAVVEAMKMQNDVRAGQSGTVAEVRVATGESVTAHQVLIVLS